MNGCGYVDEFVMDFVCQRLLQMNIEWLKKIMMMVVEK